MKNKTDLSWFNVRAVTVVDHPELRNDSYAPVKPGHVIVNNAKYTSRRAAVAFFQELLAGEWDFGSEYVRSVEVTEHFPHTFKPARTVRARVERDPRATKAA
jgi:hypothetical protein